MGSSSEQLISVEMMARLPKPLLLSQLALVIIQVAGCASAARLPVPEELSDRAQIPRFENVRFLGDSPPAIGQAIVQAKLEQSIRTRPKVWRRGRVIDVNFLIISGGGGGGAYGAGLLSGWSESGKRPAFEVVTGVSTGALIAPFAFLGPDHDDKLRKFYTTLSTKDLIEERSIVGAIFGDAFASTAPLRAVIAEYVDRQLLHDITEQHRQGRRLFVATTNLDSQKSVIWNLGKIAEQDSQEALVLFRQILLASTAIPGLFPPVRLNVDVEGKQHDELHVDGGVLEDAFFLPLKLPLDKVVKGAGLRMKRRMYIIRNARSQSEWQAVNPTTLSITERAVWTLMKSASLGSIYKLYSFASINKIEFKFTSIPASFKGKPKEMFDTEYQKKLYAAGREIGLRGGDWANSPP